MPPRPSTRSTSYPGTSGSLSGTSTAGAAPCCGSSVGLESEVRKVTVASGRFSLPVCGFVPRLGSPEGRSCGTFGMLAILNTQQPSWAGGTGDDFPNTANRASLLVGPGGQDSN